MDKQDKTQEFSLEDILREFGSESREDDGTLSPEAPGETLPEPEDTPAPAENPEPEELPQEDLPITEDTILLEVLAELPGSSAPAEDSAPADTPAPSPVTDDTIRLDDLTEALERSRLIGMAAKEFMAENGIDPDAEEASDAPAGQTEPEAEQDEEQAPEEIREPLDSVELHPTETPKLPPIVFRSRLRELKKKLVAGPEKRYYDLTEVGLGRVQIAIFVNILIVILCAGATGLYAMGAVLPSRLRLMIFSQILAMMVSVLLGCYVLLDGIVDLFRGKFSLNTVLLLTLAACAADAVICLQELRVPCCAAFCLEMTMALWNRYLRRSTEMSQMDTLRKANRLDGLVKVENYFEGRPGILRADGQVDDFMDNYDETTGPEKVQNIFALVSVVLCIAIAVFTGLRHGMSLAVQILSTSLLVAVPATFFISQSRPAAILQRRLHMVGTVLCGWQGVKTLLGGSVFPIRDRDLFPLGSTKLNGVKFFGDRDPDQVIAYAAAMIRVSGSPLEPIFSQLLKSRSGVSFSASHLRSYSAGGISGEVCGESVLLGTQDFLVKMGVEIPGGTMVNQAVYCAIDGEFCAVFAISYNRLKAAAAGLVTLYSYRKLNPLMLSTDFIIDESFIRSKFGVKTKRFFFPTRDIRDELTQVKPSRELIAGALLSQDNLSAAAYAVSGARALRTASKVGLGIHIAAGILGMLIMLALGYIGSVELLTPFNVLMYQLVWALPGILITEWTRAV